MARAGRVATLPGLSVYLTLSRTLPGCMQGDLLTLSQPSCLTLYDTLNHGAEKTCIVSYISVINGRYE